MDVLDVDDTDDEILMECEDCMFAPDLIPMHQGKYFCSVCSRIYYTELGDKMKHHMQLKSEVDNVMIAESACSVCSRIYYTELGDKMKHHMQLKSEVDNVMIAESAEPMIVNFPEQYYTPKTSDDDDNNNNNNNKKSNQFLEDKFLRKRGIIILEHTTYYDNVE